jgi:hypothetical protein
LLSFFGAHHSVLPVSFTVILRPVFFARSGRTHQGRRRGDRKGDLWRGDTKAAQPLAYPEADRAIAEGLACFPTGIRPARRSDLTKTVCVCGFAVGHPGISRQKWIPPGQILSRFDRQHLEAFMKVPVELMDVIDATRTPSLAEAIDARQHEAGLPEDAEPAGDEQDAAWVEWTSMRGSQKPGANLTTGHEDDEEDAPPGQCDEDGIHTDFALGFGGGPGCKISDPGYGTEDENEREEGECGYNYRAIPALRQCPGSPPKFLCRLPVRPCSVCWLSRRNPQFADIL